MKVLKGFSVLMSFLVVLFLAGKVAFCEETEPEKVRLEITQELLQTLVESTRSLEEKVDEVLKELRKEEGPKSNATVEARLSKLSEEVKEIKIQQQLMVKALLGLVGVLFLITIVLIFRSRRPPRSGSIRF